MDALVLVDVQKDFAPGGALEVPEGDQIIPVINRLMPRFALVVATKDWHPPNHKSFASQHPGHEVGETIEVAGLDQYLWPDHAVQNTPGAEFIPGLDTSRFDRVFLKGDDVEIDSYSGFFDNGHRKATGLGDYLKERGVTDVYVAGLATDYCVKFTVLDAVKLGFNTHVIVEAIRGVNVQPGDADQALQEMQDAGARLVNAAGLQSKDATTSQSDRKLPQRQARA